MSAPLPFDILDDLTTPLLWLDADARVAHTNLAAGRWLGVCRRRLLGTPAGALERQTQTLAAALQCAREIAAKPTMTSDRSPDIGPKSNKDFGWAFETGELVAEGSYEIEIRDIMLGDLAVGDQARFSFNTK